MKMGSAERRRWSWHRMEQSSRWESLPVRTVLTCRFQKSRSSGVTPSDRAAAGRDSGGGAGGGVAVINPSECLRANERFDST